MRARDPSAVEPQRRRTPAPSNLSAPDLSAPDLSAPDLSAVEPQRREIVAKPAASRMGRTYVRGSAA
jgi:hypothetical protein